MRVIGNEGNEYERNYRPGSTRRNFRLAGCRSPWTNLLLRMLHIPAGSSGSPASREGAGIQKVQRKYRHTGQLDLLGSNSRALQWWTLTLSVWDFLHYSRKFPYAHKFGMVNWIIGWNGGFICVIWSIFHQNYICMLFIVETYHLWNFSFC